MTVIAPDEVGIARRFGRPVEDLPPGWYWRLPWPIEDTLRVSKQVRTVSIGFKESLEKNATTGALTWSSAHRKETRIEREALMMTGDGNLVDLLVTVRFRVADPRVFLFEVQDADEVLRATTESELRAMVAARPFPELLTVKRGEFQKTILQRVQARASAMPAGLGVAIEGISIIDLHPPGDVVKSYYEVAEAMQKKDQMKNEAMEFAIKKTIDTEAEVVKIVTKAQALAAEKRQLAETDRQRFLGLYRPRKELSVPTEVELAAIAFPFRGLSDGLLKYQEDRARRVAMQAGLVDFRAYWDAVGRALTGRDFLLIDSDKINVRQNWMLFDPDVFRVPVPVFMPAERPMRSEGP
jgi:regulator of protease activity HflC (stomatin/prohibitin superfamily)